MRYCIFLSAFFVASILYASQETNGPHGINSTGLMGFFTGAPLTGAGVSIGQVELERPGKLTTNGGPDDAAHTNSFINPKAVFYQNMQGKSTDNIINHAEAIAGIMISTDSVRTGVATQADLYSGAFQPTTTISENDAEVTAANIAAQNGGNVRAINMSFGLSDFSSGVN